MARLETGPLVATQAIAARMETDGEFRKFVYQSLDKYLNCDWGDTCEEDAALNDEAVKNGERILAVYMYKEPDVKIWIITEWDRSATTILFPEEY